jgi:serine/threonine-protein kinase
MGVVLYELTAGRRPFEAESTYAVLEAQLNAAPRPPLELNPSLPKLLNDIIMTALEKEPMRRFQSAEAFRKALESLKAPQPAGQPVLTSSLGAKRGSTATPTATAAPTGRNRGLWMALGAVACVLVLIAAALAMPHFWRSSAASKNGSAQTASAAIPSASPVSQPPTTLAVVPNQPAMDTTPQNQQVSPITHPVPQTVARSLPRRQVGVPVQAAPAANQMPPSVATPAPVQTAPPSSAPSQEEIEKVQETLMQLHSRADAVRGSVNNLRRQQAADGLEISPEIAGAVSRMDNYLQAADRAAQNSDLAAARKYMEGAERQVSVLEAKFGR